MVAAAPDADGNAVFVISELAEHTHNLHRDGRSSLLLVEGAAEDAPADPLARGRLTLLGHTALVAPAEQAAATAVVVGRFGDVAHYAGFDDFNCWRLEVESVRWVGGFGRMDWIDLDAYRLAAPDPILPHRHRIITHMNDDHADAGITLCRRAVDDAGRELTVTAARLVAVDRFGCDYSASVSDGDEVPKAPVPIRLAFTTPATSVDDVRRELVAMVRAR